MSETRARTTQFLATVTASAVAVLVLGLAAGCSRPAPPTTALNDGSTAGPLAASTSATNTVTSPGTPGSDDTPTRMPSQTTPATRCAQTPASAGPAAQLITLTVSAPATAASGSALTVVTTIVATSNGPRLVLKPAGSRLEILNAGAVVATAAGTGLDVPVPILAGRTLPAQTIPPSVPLLGCDGAALPAGTYVLRATLAYGSDPLNNANDSTGGHFQLHSDPVTLTIY